MISPQEPQERKLLGQTPSGLKDQRSTMALMSQDWLCAPSWALGLMLPLVRHGGGGECKGGMHIKAPKAKDPSPLT